MSLPPSPRLLQALADLLGPKGFSVDADVMAPWLTDWRGKYHGQAAAMLSPASTEEVAEIVLLCAAEGAAIVPQGGNSGMVGGATPDASGHQLLLSLRRMNRIRSIDTRAAEKIPGVIKVFTSKDFEGKGGVPCGWQIHDRQGKPNPYPEKVEIILEKDKDGAALFYTPGEYTFAPESIYVDRNGSLAISPRLVALQRTPKPAAA